MTSRQRRIGSLWHSFLYEVNKTTASLMYLLQGMESVRNSELSSYNNLPTLSATIRWLLPKVALRCRASVHVRHRLRP